MLDPEGLQGDKACKWTFASDDPRILPLTLHMYAGTTGFQLRRGIIGSGLKEHREPETGLQPTWSGLRPVHAPGDRGRDKCAQFTGLFPVGNNVKNQEIKQKTILYKPGQSICT